jgi:hypothetical protein
MLISHAQNRIPVPQNAHILPPSISLASRPLASFPSCPVIPHDILAQRTTFVFRLVRLICPQFLSSTNKQQKRELSETVQSKPDRASWPAVPNTGRGRELAWVPWLRYTRLLAYIKSRPPSHLFYSPLARVCVCKYTLLSPAKKRPTRQSTLGNTQLPRTLPTVNIMGFFSKKQPAGDGEPTVAEETDPQVNYNKEEATGDAREKAPSADGDSPLPESNADYQAGVQRIEAATSVWGKWDMIFAYGA